MILIGTELVSKRAKLPTAAWPLCILALVRRMLYIRMQANCVPIGLFTALSLILALGHRYQYGVLTKLRTKTMLRAFWIVYAVVRCRCS